MSENGKAWRLDCAVKGAWSTNGAYVVLDHVPTVAEMRKLGITVPDNWDGLRVWRGKIAEQLDNENSLERGHQAHCCPTIIPRRTSIEVLLVFATSYRVKIMPLEVFFQIN